MKKNQSTQLYAFLFCTMISLCMAEIITVDNDGPADFATIQAAIDYSWDGDTIIVEPGTYSESIKFNGRAVTLTGTEPNNPSVVSSTIITNTSGTAVTFEFGEKENSIFTGFNVSDGGIFCYYSSPTISKNFIQNKGIYMTGASPVIRENTIKYCVIITAHDAVFISGGALSGQDNSEPDILYNTIADNRVEYTGTVRGGAIAGCDGTIACNHIYGNKVQVAYNPGGYYYNSYGGAIDNCQGAIKNNIIYNNSAKAGPSRIAYGSALSNCHGEIVNNTIIYNSSQRDGGALFNCSGIVKNNIIANNSGGGIYGASQNSYNDFWNNTPWNFSGGAMAQEGDIVRDPLLGSNNHLKSSAGRWTAIEWVLDDVDSPCIDAGDPLSAIGVEPNPNGDRINMGAYGGTSEASKSPSGIITPVCTNPPSMDTNNDCKIDLVDFVAFASQWMTCGYDIQEACWE